MEEIIYFANNLVEADILISHLKNHNISASVNKQPENEKIGLINPIGFIGVQVKNDDVKEALIIVKDWKEKRELELTPEKPPKTFRYMVLSLILGVILGASYYENKYILSPQGTEESLNNKGFFYQNDRLVRWELDNNKDSKIDEIRHYNDQGKVYKIEGDYNYNGIFETFSHYENETIIESSVDTDEDTKIDRTNYYKNGGWFKTEYFDFKTRKVFKIDLSNGLYSIESKIDVDRDGKFDDIEKYNQYSELIKKEKINP